LPEELHRIKAKLLKIRFLGMTNPVPHPKDLNVSVVIVLWELRNKIAISLKICMKRSMTNPTIYKVVTIKGI
jgi:hypothetical protein